MITPPSDTTKEDSANPQSSTPKKKGKSVSPSSPSNPKPHHQPDYYVVEFFFLFCIKSILSTQDRTFMKALTEFFDSWAKNIFKLSVSEASLRNQQVTTFLTELYDIGAYNAVSVALNAYTSNFTDSSPEKSSIYFDFVRLVLRPKIFYASSLCSDSFVKSVTDVIGKASVEKLDTPIVQNVFTLIVSLLQHYNASMQRRLVNRYVTLLSILSPLEDIPYANCSDIHSVLVLYSVLITYVNLEVFIAWWSTANRSAFFKSVHFLITHVRYNGKDPTTTDVSVVRTKELSYCVQCGVLELLRLFHSFKDEDDIVQISDLYYHMFCANKSIDLVRPLITEYTNLISSNLSVLMYKSHPALARFVTKLFVLMPLAPDAVTKFVETLFAKDASLHKTTNRSLAICVRAFSMLTQSQRLKFKFPSTKNADLVPFYNIVKNVIEYETKLTSQHLIDEIYAETVYNKAYQLLASPDASLEEFNILAEFYNKHGSYDEEIQVLLVQAAIILEYSTLLGKMKFIWNPDLKLHPGQVFEAICPSVQFVSCPNKVNSDLPKVPSFCDSSLFSERSFTDILHRILIKCQSSELYEVGYQLIDIFWPLLEHHRMFGALSTFFTTQRQICDRIRSYPEDVVRRFGHYFTVISYNQKFFPGESGVSYIYKESNSDTVDSVIDRLLRHYNGIYGDGTIEAIRTTGKVDVSKLPRDKGFIQVIPVEPNFKRKESATRLSVYEQNHSIYRFSQDHIYIPQHESLSGSENKDQWIHRQILTALKPMPTCLTRQVVLKNNITEKEYMPICVAYHILSSFVTSLHSACEVNDCAVIQSLLRASVLDIGPHTPLGIARDFLSKDNVDKKEEKYVIKLRDSEEDFLKAADKGLLLHAQWCSQFPAAIPVQNELESSFTAISDSLRSILEKIDI